MSELHDQEFRKMCIQLLNRDGKGSSGCRSLVRRPLLMIYEGGKVFVAQTITDYRTIWNDRHGGAQIELSPYYRILERWLVLEKLSDV